MYRHILIPTDGYPLSKKALTHGVELARETGAKVIILTVTEPFHMFSLDVDQVEDTPAEYRKHMQARAECILEDSAKVAALAGVRHEKLQVEDAHPYRAIIRVGEERDCDLIVMASHGRRGVSALILGSETAKVLAHSSIPVLVCRLAGSERGQNSEAEERVAESA
jgi:nucleotide-binding universal stress UspA family protein